LRSIYDGTDQTVYLVLNNFDRYAGPTARPAKSGPTWTVISDLIAGQYDNPDCVVAFNTTEHWADDVSEDIAREVIAVLVLPVTSCHDPSRHLSTGMVRPSTHDAISIGCPAGCGLQIDLSF
jgi:hypothetical protein